MLCLSRFTPTIYSDPNTSPPPHHSHPTKWEETAEAWLKVLRQAGFSIGWEWRDKIYNCSVGNASGPWPGVPERGHSFSGERGCGIKFCPACRNRSRYRSAGRIKAQVDAVCGALGVVQEAVHVVLEPPTNAVAMLMATGLAHLGPGAGPRARTGAGAC